MNRAASLRLDVLGRLKLARYFFGSLRRRGIWRTLKISFFEIYYELKFQTRTGYVIPTTELDGDSAALACASDYFPSSYLILREAFVGGTIDCTGSVLIDYGCGLGRTLLFASTLPLDEMIGIELSPSLSRKASANLTRLYARSKKQRPKWQVINADARRFDIPSRANIFYFFNPFDAVVLADVIDRIAASLAESPRSCTIVYANPIHEAVIAARGFARSPMPSKDLAIFSHTPAARAYRS
jgi:hypothetical protein